LRPCVGPPLRESFARFLDANDAPLIERAVAHYRERFADVGWRENVAYAGIADALATLAACDARLYVCTAKPEPFARRIV
jgi:phosphoglycolate phosphatase